MSQNSFLKTKFSGSINNLILLTKKKYFPQIVIALLGLIVFLPLIEVKFFGDEIAFINRNQIHLFSDLFSLFLKKNYDWIYYRPLSNFVSGIITLLFKYNVVYYRIFNIFLHIINSIVLFYFTKNLFKLNRNSIKIAFVSALLFLIFPLNNLTIIWHTDLFDRLLFPFYLLSLIYFMHSFRANFLSLLFFLLALLSKEMAFSLPLIIIITNYFLYQKKLLQSIIKSLPYIVLAATYLLLRIILFNNNILISHGVYAHLGIIDILKNYIFFLGLLIIPVFTTTLHLFVKTHFLLANLTGILFIFFIAALFYKKFKNDKLIYFLVLFVLFTFLPASRVLMKWYLYLPSAGFVILISYLIFQLKEKRFRFAVIIAFSIIIIYTTGTFANEYRWINITNRGKKIVNMFLTDYKTVIDKNQKLIFLTVPAKVEGIPVFQLQFDTYLNHFIGTNKQIDVLTNSSLSSFSDKIKLEKLHSSIILSNTKLNFFILFNGTKNKSFKKGFSNNGLLQRIKFQKKLLNEGAVFYFSQGKFIMIN